LENNLKEMFGISFCERRTTSQKKSALLETQRTKERKEILFVPDYSDGEF
jgi:hypothetical protein